MLKKVKTLFLVLVMMVAIIVPTLAIKAEENKEKTPHTHVGWENTKKMLRILYGDHYKFQVWSEPGKGTEIEIAVPIERGGNYVESDSSR